MILEEKLLVQKNVKRFTHTWTWSDGSLFTWTVSNEHFSSLQTHSTSGPSCFQIICNSVNPNHGLESIPLLRNCNSFLILALGVETWLEMQNNAFIQNQLKQLLDFPTQWIIHGTVLVPHNRSSLMHWKMIWSLVTEVFLKKAFDFWFPPPLLFAYWECACVYVIPRNTNLHYIFGKMQVLFLGLIYYKCSVLFEPYHTSFKLTIYYPSVSLVL